MDILIHCNKKDPRIWAEGVKAKLPEVNVWIYPNVPNPEAISFAIVWKPDQGVLSSFPKLEVVQSLGASVYHILSTQTLSSDVSITRIVDPTLSGGMWEFSLAGVLNRMKRFRFYQNQQRENKWKPIPYQSISGTKIGILGLGKIGAFVAEKFVQTGFQVRGWSASPKNIEGISSFHGEDGLKEMLKDLDFLINILPMTPQTEGLINISSLSTIKEGAFFINIGRGPTVVDDDLIKMLDSGKLSGALLDVFYKEPLPEEHAFWQHPSIQITPHIASLTDPNSAMEQVIENYVRWKEGRPLLNLISIEKGY